MTYVLRITAAAVALVLPRAAAAQTDIVSFSSYLTEPALAGRVRAIAHDFGGTLLAVGGDADEIVLYDLSAKRVRQRLAANGRVEALAFSRDDALLVAGTARGAVVLTDVRTGQQRQLDGHRGAVLAVAASPANDLIASAGADKEIVLWSPATGQQVGRLRGGHGKEIRFVAFGGRGETLISVGADRRIITWDVKTKTRLRQTEEPDPYVPSAAASPGGEVLILGTENTQLPGARGGIGVNRGGLVYQDRIKFYDMQSGMAQKVIENITAEPISVSLSADRKYVAVATKDVKRSAVSVWEIERGVQIAELPSAHNVTRVAFAPDGKWLSYGTERGGVAVARVTGVYERQAPIALVGRRYTVTSPRTPLVTPTRRVRFAVLDLDNLGVEDHVSRIISDQLTNRLAANPGVRLVERRRIGALLQEQEFQQSGRTDPGTAVRLARVLNVQKVIMGSVGRLGTTMTITAQLVDVETAQIDGVREMVCRACSEEDLPDAVAEMAETLVAPADGTLPQAPPPRIEIDSPRDGAEVAEGELVLKGRIEYAGGLEGVELLVNGTVYPATRLLAAPQGKVTPLAGRLREFPFVQTVPLQERNNVIAVRAIGADGNDEQQYLFVRRTAAPRTASTAPSAGPPPRPAKPEPLGLREVLDALAGHVGSERLAQHAKRFGVGFKVTPDVERQLRAKGATEALIAALR